jgi:hypothetical protein
MSISIKLPLSLALFLSLAIPSASYAQSNLQTDHQSDSSEVELNIFPNPNRGTFYITLVSEDSYYAQLYALDGRMVKTFYLQNGLNYISIAIPSGFYILQLNEGEAKQNFRIQIK